MPGDRNGNGDGEATLFVEDGRAGRLRGGAAVRLAGREHAVDEGGRLDLSACGLGPRELAELAPQLTGLSQLTLDGNGIFGELYPNGRAKEADKFADQCEPFFAALKDSQIAVLSLKSTGMGPAACGMLATSVSAAMS